MSIKGWIVCRISSASVLDDVAGRCRYLARKICSVRKWTTHHSPKIPFIFHQYEGLNSKSKGLYLDTHMNIYIYIYFLRMDRFGQTYTASLQIVIPICIISRLIHPTVKRVYHTVSYSG